ncbi:MAG: hypothetical protein JO295_13215 [Verrucomicrobia bacterium]|nr:hypothetical protein [Verrucomicrobiota bacterium]
MKNRNRCTHDIIELPDRRELDVFTNHDRGWRLTVSRVGAELIGLARHTPSGDWRRFLWRDGETDKPAEGWGNHATVMGYYLHRLLNERSLYRGQEIRGGTHSFIRHKTFPHPRGELFLDGGVSLVYDVKPAMFEPHEYPLRVALQLSYHFAAEDDDALHVQFRFKNEELELSAHVSFGLHPGFAVGSLADCVVEMPAGRYVRWLAPGNFLSGETQTIDHAGGPMPFAKSELPGSFLLDLTEIPPEARVFTLHDAAGGRRVTVRCVQAPYLTLWSDGHDFVCIEPCWGMPDHHSQRPFEEKLGIQEIPPGGELLREFSLRAELLA